MRRRFTKVHAYIGKEYLFSFFVAFLFFFFIFFINQMLLLAEDVLSKHVPVLDVIRLIVYSLPAVVAISFPFASLVGALMAIGRISSDNETVAFQASGIPLRKLFTPVLVLGLVFSLVSFVMNDYFLPLGTINFGRVYRRLLSANPELELESFAVKKFQDSVIITGAVRGRNIEDIVILDRTAEQDKRVIVAGNGMLLDNPEQAGSVVSLELEDVFSQSVPEKKMSEFEYSESRGMVYNILLADIAMTLHNPQANEMGSRDVYEVIRKRRSEMAERERAQQMRIQRYEQQFFQTYYGGLESIANGTMSPDRLLSDLSDAGLQLASERAKKLTDRTLQIHRLEFHKKFALPFACVFFVFLAFPVGLFSRRSGRSVGFGIGLFVSIFYWGMLIAGQTFGLRTYFSPVLSMWLPNAIILALGTVLFVVRLRR